MNKTHLINEILAYKDRIGRFEICIGTFTKADFVLGYFWDEQSNEYKVYKNGERGMCSVRYSGADELEALKILLRMVKGRAHTLAELNKMRDTR